MNTYNLSKFTSEQLRRILRIIQLIIDQIERSESSRYNPFITIPAPLMHKEGYVVYGSSPEPERLEAVSKEVMSVILAINQISKKPIIVNASAWLWGHPEKDLHHLKNIESRLEELKKYSISISDLRDNFTLKFLTPSSQDAINKLKDMEKEISKQLRQRTFGDELLRVEITSMPKVKIEGLEKEVISRKSDRPRKKFTTHPIPDKYKISVRDREIWVNEYLIGKPHAVGSNFEFFDYIRLQKPNTKISREALPGVGSLSLKERVKSKSFIKIVNELGFKGEILKAFFYKRGKDTLIYRGDQITKEDLKKAGLRILVFLQELKLAHTKNSPE